ncbi:MAG: GFA family protein [Alphaproteobacteria bacterium]
MTDMIEGTCHCGAVKWQAPNNVLGETGNEAYLCNCSLCRRKQQITAVVPKRYFTLVHGEDNLSCYQWNKHIAKHWFCKTCGVYTHHQRRADPNTIGLNLACVEGIDLNALTIKSIDGKSYS